MAAHVLPTPPIVLSRLHVAVLLALAALPSRGQDAQSAPASGTAAPIERLAPTSFVAREDDVPVRAEPGFVYRVIARLGRGEGVVVNGRRDQWLRIAGGGWVLANQVASREEASAAAPHAPGSSAPTAWTVAAASANIRSARSTDAPVVRRLVQGDAVPVTAMVDGWAEVPGGWIRADLLQQPPHRLPAGASPVATDGGPRHWSLLALSGIALDVYELQDPVLIARIREELRAVSATEATWTVLGITVSVAKDAQSGFAWSPEHTTFVAVDTRGEKYGNVFAKGQLERLPPGLHEALGPRGLEPGQRFSGLILFRPTLVADEIAELSVRIDGRLQRFMP